MVRLLQGFTTAHSLPVTQQPTSHCQPVSLPSPCTGAALSGDKKPKINLQAGSSLTAYHNPLKRVTRTKRLQAASPRHFLMCSEEMCCPPHSCFPCLPSDQLGASAVPYPFTTCSILQSTSKLHASHHLSFLFCLSGSGTAKHRDKGREKSPTLAASSCSASPTSGRSLLLKSPSGGGWGIWAHI